MTQVAPRDRGGVGVGVGMGLWRGRRSSQKRRGRKDGQGLLRARPPAGKAFGVGASSRPEALGDERLYDAEVRALAPGKNPGAVGHLSTGCGWHRWPRVEAAAWGSRHTWFSREPSEHGPPRGCHGGHRYRDDDHPACASHHASHSGERRSVDEGVLDPGVPFCKHGVQHAEVPDPDPASYLTASATSRSPSLPPAPNGQGVSSWAKSRLWTGPVAGSQRDR